MIGRMEPPLRIIPRPAEAAYSVLQRLARRHNCLDVAALQKIIDLQSNNPRNASVTAETVKYIYKNGILPQNEIDDCVIYSKNGGTFVGSTCLSQIYEPRRILKRGPVCLSCLEKDVNLQSDYSGPMTYRRWYWDLNYLAICAHHHHRLLYNCPRCQKQLTWKPLDPRYCTCGADLLQSITHSKDAIASEAQKHIANATLGLRPSGSGPLAELAPKEIQDLTVRLALQLRPVTKQSSYNLLPQANDEFQDEAFQAFRYWPDGFDELLDHMRAQSASSKSHINEAYGSLYRWLTRRRYKCYDPIVDRITVHYEHSIRHEKPRNIFKVVSRAVKQMSIYTLSQELSAPRTLVQYFQKLASEKRGEIYVARSWLTEDEVIFARTFFDKLVDKSFIQKNISSSSRNISNLVSTGFLEEFSVGFGSKPYYYAESAQRLAGFITKARAMGVTVSNDVVSLSKRSLLSKWPMTFYLNSILQNRIRVVGHDGGKDGLSGLLMRKMDIDEAYIAEKNNIEF